jgi:hypothetical protein
MRAEIVPALNAGAPPSFMFPRLAPRVCLALCDHH